MHSFPPVFFGTLREHYLMLFGAAGVVAMFFGFVGAWFGARFGARAAARRALREMRSELPAREPAVQLGDLGRAIDAIALEVERISEAQRFTARILAERPAVAPPTERRREAGQVTPH